MISSLLIANRGEIACRIIRTAKRLGIRTIAVYSEADKNALHVELADQAVGIGPAPASKSYLDIDEILAAAMESGAEAIHPGYGFLSENAVFAARCQTLGLVFVGPPASAISAMGSKSAAKSIMEKAYVPLVPGYHGDNQDPKFLQDEADKIGYPLLIKASAGGGGKGMRLVDMPLEFAGALEAAKREAMNAFGDDHVLLEKYIGNPRHIEIQVFADRKGNAVHLFERDCSIQRRHQKIVEEAPAPGLSKKLRKEMGQAAVSAAKAIGYEGAGTVEFIADAEAIKKDTGFYFMEMNTRLQVEHPVTEMITGEDLVEWQLRVASGEVLPKKQEQLSMNGHAIETRLYAEDAANNFMPSTGNLWACEFPNSDGFTRIDAGVRTGDEVTAFYDPMIAKIITFGNDREAARRRHLDCLSKVRVGGIKTNLPLLAQVVASSGFAQGEVTTHFLAENPGLLASDQAVDPAVWSAAALVAQKVQQEGLKAKRSNSLDPHSPWTADDGWRLDVHSSATYDFATDDGKVSVELWTDRVKFNDIEMSLSYVILGSGRLQASIGGEKIDALYFVNGSMIELVQAGQFYRFEVFDPLTRGVDNKAAGGLSAPMPGSITSIGVVVGQSVSKGDHLLTMEAMKMEISIAAPTDGVIEALPFAIGAQVEQGQALVVLESGE
jgi:3-methylcrotonyl-CoA carboxylase alpha subunit